MGTDTSMTAPPHYTATVTAAPTAVPTPVTQSPAETATEATLAQNLDLISRNMVLEEQFKTARISY